MLAARKFIPEDSKLSLAWAGTIILISINVFIFLLIYSYVEPTGAFLQEWVNKLRLTKIFKLNWGNDWVIGIFGTIGNLILLLMWLRILEIISGGITFWQKQSDGSFRVVSFPYFVSRKAVRIDLDARYWSFKQNPVEAFLGEGVLEGNKGEKVRLRLNSEIDLG